MCFFCWVDKFNDSLEMLFVMFLDRLRWYWDSLTILSILIVIAFICLSGLICLHLQDHKKLCSRAFKRGREYEKSNRKIFNERR